VTPIELIEAMKQHVARLTTQRGAAGEIEALGSMANWLPRPKGPGLKVLLAALRDSGIVIKKSSFDAIAMPEAQSFDFCDQTAVRSALPDMVFIEIKTANQDRVGVDFSGYFFSLTESEIVASEALGKRHRVALYNKSTRVLFMTSVSELLARAKSATWQFSIQL
jgi:hypothetical protein